MTRGCAPRRGQTHTPPRSSLPRPWGSQSIRGVSESSASARSARGSAAGEGILRPAGEASEGGSVTRDAGRKQLALGERGLGRAGGGGGGQGEGRGRS